MLLCYTYSHKNVLEQRRKEVYRDILGLLSCPICKGKFSLNEREVENEEIVEGSLICANAHRYAIRKGVIDFGSQEQEGLNTWKEFLKENNYEELDLEIEQQKTEKEKEQQQKHIDSIVKAVAKLEKGYVVDIASGRGMLLTQLVQNVKADVGLIATDLSFDILMYDRMKIKKFNPTARVNYIACDATAMPLEDGSVDMTVSFYGIANMVGIVEAGIREASRVTKEKGKFLNAYLAIKEESEGFSMMKKFCEENGVTGAERACLDSVMQDWHSKYFDEIVADVVVEDIYHKEENKLDLLPYNGEWFAYVTCEGRK